MLLTHHCISAASGLMTDEKSAEKCGFGVCSDAGLKIVLHTAIDTLPTYALAYILSNYSRCQRVDVFHSVPACVSLHLVNRI